MMKKVIVEALALGFNPCGLREFTLQICSRLARKSHPGLSMTFIVPPGMSGCFGSGVDYIEAGGIKARLLRRLPLLKADLFHALHQLCLVKHLHGVPNRLLTIHDINFAHTRSGRKYKASEGRFLYRLDHATHVSFISRYAHDDVASRFPFNLPWRIIPNGVTPPDFDSAKRPEALPHGVNGFLLHLSSLAPYKNPKLLVEMMDYLPGRTLVIAGYCKDAMLAAMVAKRSDVIMLGPVTDSERTWLYANCEAFLFPSLAEGFGLPPLEAMLAGKPVFLSTATSLPEVGGDVAFYWPELRPAEMAQVLESKLQNPPDASVLRRQAAQFNWDVAAGSYFQYYLDILELK